MTRREFGPKFALKVGGVLGIATGITAALRRLLSRPHADHGEHADDHAHEKAQLFEQLLQNSAEFRSDPERWWRVHREQLRVSRNVRHVARCIDEGVELGHVPQLRRNNNIDAVSLPGSGITLDAAEPTTADEYRIILASMRGHAEGTCNHAGCAACAGIGSSDEGEGFARRLAADLDSRYLGKVNDLTRPSWHPALASVLRYEPTYRNPFPNITGAPSAFDTSMWVFSGEGRRRQRVKLAGLPIRIAFGDHGNGPLFTTENKFLIPYTFNPKSRTHSRRSIEDEILEAASLQGKGPLVQPIPLPTE